ncbi:MAG: prenyltransferase/squalene oxidase repeat-containing protein [Planctomycetota bacterium]|nr:prenyltransferase/squalene oxidase repeat-containing protein [Planctomycetota bacterium]
MMKRPKRDEAPALQEIDAMTAGAHGTRLVRRFAAGIVVGCLCILILGCAAPREDLGAASRAEGALARPPSPPPTRDPRIAHARGLRFLLRTQNEDGSWGSFRSARPYEIMLGTTASFDAFGDATTALCVMALHGPSRDDERARVALDRGMRYLLNAEPVGRATGEVFYDTWAHTYIIQALARLYHDERFAYARRDIARVVRREIDILSNRQAADGGWGYYDFGHSLPTPTGSESTSFNTAAVLIALREARQAGFEVGDDVIHDGLMCLQRLRLPSGAYVYGTYAQLNPAAGYNRIKGSLGRSQVCNYALRVHGRDMTREDLLAGIENLREHHHFIEIGKARPYPHEAWYYTAGYYFLFGHYYASLVIGELPPEERAEYADWLARTMWRLQDPDGSWFDFPLYGYHKPYGTAFAIMTLQECLRER